MKTLKVIQGTRVYRSIALDSDHYLLCAKVSFPTRGLNKNLKSFNTAKRISKIRLLTTKAEDGFTHKERNFT
jgi:hypothetical protein